jgi:hypothetical protein
VCAGDARAELRVDHLGGAGGSDLDRRPGRVC